MTTTYRPNENDPLVFHIHIALEEADYQEQKNKTIKEYARKAQIKGFRPGKVPASIIEKMYGKQIVNEAAFEIAKRTLPTIIKEQKWQIIGMPIEDIEAYKNYNLDTKNPQIDFFFKVGIIENAALADIDLTDLQLIQVALDDTDLDNLIEDIRQANKVETEVTSVEKGDFIYATMKASDQAENEKFLQISQNSQFEGAEDLNDEGNVINKEKNYINIVLPSDKIKTETYALFEGKTKEEVVTFDIKDLFENIKDFRPFLSITPEVAETMQGEYVIQIEKITRSIAPALNEEFLDKITPLNQEDNTEDELQEDKPKKTIAEYREILRMKRTAELEKEAFAYNALQLKKAIIEKSPIRYSDDFLLDYIQYIGQGEQTIEDIKKSLQDSKDAYKWALIKSTIPNLEDIEKVTENEAITELFTLVLNSYNDMGYTRYFSNEHLKTMVLETTLNIWKSKQKNDLIQKNYIINRLKEKKVLAHLLQQMKPEVVNYTERDFIALLKQEQAKAATSVVTDKDGVPVVFE